MFQFERKSSDRRPLCLAVGAGAIGKSVAGYIFSGMGAETVFLDVSEQVIRDINRRGGYRIFNMRDGKRANVEVVEGLCARRIEDAAELFLRADFLSTAIGPSGQEEFFPLLCKWVALRDRTDGRVLRLMFFENDASCEGRLIERIQAELGRLPSWLKIAKTSVERMTMTLAIDSRCDVAAEPFRKVVVDSGYFEQCGLCGTYFEPVADVGRYYRRKLYLNNLGHAVMAYRGLAKGYRNTVQALADREILAELRAVLSEASRVLEAEYGFRAEELSAHVDELIVIRYRCFEDDLGRLARNPVRKLGREERILGVLEKGFARGIDVERTAKLLPYIPLCGDAALRKILESDGWEGVLTQCCGLRREEELFGFLNRYLK